ncbi:trypsin-like peptidase domain-containing protein [Pontibacter qinzhouensis]|uniref:Trypsin-like peptidase domain-containing protein n=1 Tax=Pontibacter qinzhouensis TaxID=2603253 RepID=A0A5C8KCT6_9BACT|nr:serine protease [Pontibacter qinzhouensis]TXK52103.1 trypsin-like peptidase domain-containing protein [Pontibacter qinzhouensis]
MFDYSIYEQIERYISGSMLADEKVTFEALLQTDSRLAEKVREHQTLLKAMRQHGQRQSLRHKLDMLHAEIEAPAATPSLFKVFWNKHRQTMAVAASVSLLSVFGTLWSVQQLKEPVQQQTARYVELRREVERIKKEQRAIIDGIIGTEAEKPAPRAARFSGTGFAVSSDGYIVTNSHVIQGADSVMIENKAGLRYKVTAVYRDKTHDLAILKIEDPTFEGFGKLPYTFKTTESDLGEKVFTLGYPREDIVFGEGSLSSSSGFEGDTTAYQISIPLNPGNSGGPLLDDKGHLIGIISGKQAGQEGAAFAVKSAYLLKVLGDMPGSDSTEIALPRYNHLTGNSRTNQLKKLKDYVFVVKVYN